MGHIRLGALPKTRKWQQVVDLVGAGADVAAVAAATSEAAERALAHAAEDPAVAQAVWLLTQLPLAARADDYVGRLRELGLEVSDSPTLMEVVGAYTDAVDKYCQQRGGRTDFGEMAQLAAAEALTATVGQRLPSLFGPTAEDVRGVLAGLATTKQFGALARDFFSRFTERFLIYHVDRELPRQVGPEGRFPSNGQRGSPTNPLDQP